MRLARAGLFVTVARAAALIIDVIPNLLGHCLDSFWEGDLLHLHEKAEYVSALACRKAVVVATLRAYVEGRSLSSLKGDSPFKES